MIKFSIILFCCGGFLYLIVAGSRLQFKFLDYCRHVAEADGRMKEFSSGGTDDAGLSRFEINLQYDLFKKISQVRDPDLLLLRPYFRRKFSIMLVVSVSWVIALSVLFKYYL